MEPIILSNIFKGDLSRDEIKMLPFELKVCWMHQSWNKRFAPRSVKEWANGMGWLAFKEIPYGEETYDIKKAKDDALKTVNNTIDYIKNCIMNPDITDAETEYITELKKHFDDGKPTNEQARRDWF
jgi:hypothetical protein